MKCFVANLFAEGVNGNGIENKSNACQWKADWTIEPVFYIQYPEKKNPLKLRLVNIFVTLARIIKAITEARKYENERPGCSLHFQIGPWLFSAASKSVVNKIKCLKSFGFTLQDLIKRECSKSFQFSLKIEKCQKVFWSL